MLENIRNFFKKVGKKEENELLPSSGDAAKERLHLVLMQDRVNVSVDFVDMMKQDMIDVVKKYIDIDEKEMDVRLTNQINEDGTNGIPALYANIPIVGIKSEKNNVEAKTPKENVDDTKKVEVVKAVKTEEKSVATAKTTVRKVDKTKTAADTTTKVVRKTATKNDTKTATKKRSVAE